MRKVMLLLLAFASQGLAAISSVTLPNEDINGVDTPQVVWVDQNFDTLKVRQNQVIDTINSYVPGGGALQSLILKSNTNLNLRIDADNNASGNNLAITHNGAVDTLLKIGDDSTTKVFGGLTVNGASTLTGIATASAGVSVPDGFGLVTTISSNTRTLAGRSGTTLNFGENGGWTGMNYRLASGSHAFQIGGSTYLTISTSGVTHASLSGTGTRMVTATSAGVLGNATTIAGANTWSDGQVFSSTSTHGGDVVFSSDRTIRRDVGTGYLVLAGGSSSSDGANLLMTGGSHATAAGDWTFRSNNTDRLAWDESATLLTLTGRFTASSTVTADSIISPKFYAEGTFTATLTGVSGTVTGTASWTRVGKHVTLMLPQLVGTSNTTACTITGMPSSIYPSQNAICPADILDNTTASTNINSGIEIQTGGTIQLYRHGSTTFTSSGSKGLNGFNIWGHSVVQPCTYTLQ